MHAILVLTGILLILMLAVHIIFRAIKFTFTVFLLGLAVLAVIYVFQRYLGIDLMAVIAAHV
ncbi:MAG TPA: hypothetical protein VMV79_01775 [Alphaproteobacteria bacterium]|nr:hypothetical protein [Alphaproteobacteria bacterium]